jgi:transposase-like protein
MDANALAVKELVEETEVSSTTLYRWRQEVLAGDRMKKKESPPDNRSPEEKLRLVMEASKLSDSELGEFLRHHGIHEAQLQRWRETLLNALEAKPPKANSEQRQKIRELEREIERKDKALAEVTALLALKKKLELLWGEEGDDIAVNSDDRFSE